MDAVDRRLVDLLREDGRRSWVDLGKQVGMSSPSVMERVRKLEATGVICGFTVTIDAARAGYPLLAFVAVTQEGNASFADVGRLIAGVAGVEEVHSVTGDDSFFLKVRAASPVALEHLITKVRSVKGVSRTKTTVVLTTIAEGTPLPLDPETDRP